MLVKFYSLNKYTNIIISLTDNFNNLSHNQIFLKTVVARRNYFSSKGPAVHTPPVNKKTGDFNRGGEVNIFAVFIKKLSMNDKCINKLVLFYDEYVEFSWSKDFQLNFWKIKLDEIVKNLSTVELQTLSNEYRPLSEGIFSTYDIALGNSSGWLNIRRDTKSITKENVEDYKNHFLQEMINLSFVRYQNALERLLIQAINEVYIQIPQFDVYSRTYLNTFFKKLVVSREDNSMHLLTYLGSKNTLVKEFLDSKLNIDLNATWKELFNFFGVMRNTIVHNGMLMLWDNYKKYLSLDNNIFHYFLKNQKKLNYLN